MHYWNKENFEGLKALAARLETEPNLAPLAEYCRLREAGLRKKALAVAEIFVESALKWNPSDAQAAAITLLELKSHTTEVHQFFSHPLYFRFLIPTLENWQKNDPNAITPVRWLGLEKRDNALLLRALADNTDDVPVRKALINIELSTLDHATHHLVESIFLMTVEVAETCLEKAHQLIQSATNVEEFACEASELKNFESLINDWRSYRDNPVGTFPQWCAERGRDYGWYTIVYYDKK